MQNKEFASDQYDQIYAAGGVEDIYEMPYRHSGYYPLFKKVYRILKSRGVRSILEVGCGTGGLAHLLRDREPGRALRCSMILVLLRERTTGVLIVGNDACSSQFGPPRQIKSIRRSEIPR